uniref:Uncharacterized protein n=1 Tax=Anguilla anguilla TaxID=7936 RepID=A0A0E9WRS1_ANGAN
MNLPKLFSNPSISGGSVVCSFLRLLFKSFSAYFLRRVSPSKMWCFQS